MTHIICCGKDSIREVLDGEIGFRTDGNERHPVSSWLQIDSSTKNETGLLRVVLVSGRSRPSRVSWTPKSSRLSPFRTRDRASDRALPVSGQSLVLELVLPPSVSLRHGCPVQTSSSPAARPELPGVFAVSLQRTRLRDGD